MTKNEVNCVRCSKTIDGNENETGLIKGFVAYAGLRKFVSNRFDTVAQAPPPRFQSYIYAILVVIAVVLQVKRFIRCPHCRYIFHINNSVIQTNPWIDLT